MDTGVSVHAVAPGVGATALDRGCDGLVVFRADGEVQYVECVTLDSGMYARGSVGYSVDRPGVGNAGVDGGINVH